MIKSKFKLTDNRGYIGTVFVLLLIVGLFVYYFISNKKSTYIEIGKEGNANYLNQNTNLFYTINLIEKGEIVLGEGEAKDYKNRYYLMSVRRGKNFVSKEKKLSCYLVELIDERDLSKAYDYFLLGVPTLGNFYKYYVVLNREKLIKG